MFEFKIEGIDGVQRSLEELAERASRIGGSQEVPLGELLAPGFLSKYSRFLSVDELLEASGFKADTAEEFAKIPEEELDLFIERNTTFATWDEMLSAAGTEWAQKKLEL